MSNSNIGDLTNMIARGRIMTKKQMKNKENEKRKKSILNTFEIKSRKKNAYNIKNAHELSIHLPNNYDIVVEEKVDKNKPVDDIDKLLREFDLAKKDKKDIPPEYLWHDSGRKFVPIVDNTGRSRRVIPVTIWTRKLADYSKYENWKVNRNHIRNDQLSQMMTKTNFGLGSKANWRPILPYNISRRVEMLTMPKKPKKQTRTLKNTRMSVNKKNKLEKLAENRKKKRENLFSESRLKLQNQ